MAYTIHHSRGQQLEIVGLEQSAYGYSCEEYDVCGTIVQLDTVLHLQNKQVVNGMYETLLHHCV